MLHFQIDQWLPYPVERVFAFFADPGNLPGLMPHWQAARIEHASFVAPPPPPADWASSSAIRAGSGTRLTITARPFPFAPVRLSWEALIEDFRWNHGFCDVQLHGPFRYWRHCHTVQAARSPLDESEGTLLHDAVNYELPLGVLGAAAGKLVVQGQLAALFRLRHRRTAELLAAHPHDAG
jgi:ligand-binding SRPBCC domain-containing protein